jgi:hypothetical protein
MQDPLNINVPLAGVETSLPIIPEADYVVQCSESTVDPNKDKTGYNWNIVVNTTDVIKSTDGREVKPNFPLYLAMALQPREDSKDQEAFRRTLGEAVDALYGTTKENRPDMSREVVNGAVGRTCIAHVFIDTYQGRELNKIKRLKKLQQS